MGKRVFKYGTGAIVPDDAEYLYTREEEADGVTYVWHYFLVEDEYA